MASRAASCASARNNARYDCRMTMRALLAVTALLAAQFAAAQQYRWTDENGRVQPPRKEWLARYSPAMRSLLEVLYNERRALFGCVVIMFGTTLIAAGATAGTILLVSVLAVPELREAD